MAKGRRGRRNRAKIFRLPRKHIEMAANVLAGEHRSRMEPVRPDHAARLRKKRPELERRIRLTFAQSVKEVKQLDQEIQERWEVNHARQYELEKEMTQIAAPEKKPGIRFIRAAESHLFLSYLNTRLREEHMICQFMLETVVRSVDFKRQLELREEIENIFDHTIALRRLRSNPKLRHKKVKELFAMAKSMT